MESLEVLCKYGPMLLAAPGGVRIPGLLGKVDIEEVRREEVVEDEVVGPFSLGEEGACEVDPVTGELLHVDGRYIREPGEELSLIHISEPTRPY